MSQQNSVDSVISNAQKNRYGIWVLEPETHLHPGEVSVRELVRALHQSECDVVLQPVVQNAEGSTKNLYKVRLFEDLDIDLMTVLKELGAEPDITSVKGSVLIPVEKIDEAVKLLIKARVDALRDG